MPPPLTYFSNKLEKSVISKLEDLALSNNIPEQIHSVAPPLAPKICTVHLGELDDEKCNRNNKQKNKSEPHNTKNFINSGGQQTDKTSSPYSLKIKRPRLAKQQNSPSPVKHPLLQYSYSSSNLHTPQPLPTLISRRASMISLKSKEEKTIPKADFKMPKFTSTTEMLRQQQPDYQVSPFELPSVSPTKTTGPKSNLDPVSVTATATDITTWSTNFDNLLSDENGVKLFTRFLSDQFASENINFYQACQEYVKQDNPTSRRTHLLKIDEEFVTSEVINLNSSLTSQFKKLLDLPETELTPESLEPQITHVYQLMKTDCYPRFLQSDIYKKLFELENFASTASSLTNTPSSQNSNFSKKSNKSGTFQRIRGKLSLTRSKAAQIQSASDGGSKLNPSLGSNSSVSSSFKSLRRLTGNFSSKSSVFAKNKSSSNLRAVKSDNCSKQSATRISSHSSVALSIGDDDVLITESFPSEEQISFETVEVECYDGQKLQLCLGPDITTVKAAMVILANKLEIEADALDCYFSGEYRSLQLETSVTNIIGKKIRVERRSLFRLDLIDVQRTVGIRAKWNKTIYDALDSVLSKYNLDVQNVVLCVGDCTEGRVWSSDMLEKGTRIVDFSKPVGIFDGLRIQVNVSNKTRIQKKLF